MVLSIRQLIMTPKYQAILGKFKFQLFNFVPLRPSHKYGKIQNFDYYIIYIQIAIRRFLTKIKQKEICQRQNISLVNLIKIVIRIQKNIRRFNSYKKFQQVKQEKQEKNEKAKVIQRRFKRFSFKQKQKLLLRSLTDQNDEEQIPDTQEEAKSKLNQMIEQHTKKYKQNSQQIIEKKESISTDRNSLSSQQTNPYANYTNQIIKIQSLMKMFLQQRKFKNLKLTNQTHSKVSPKKQLSKLTEDQAVKKLQKAARVYLGVKAYKKIKKFYYTRKCTIREFVDSEKRYMDQIHKIVNLLMPEMKPVLDPKVFQTLFGNMESLLMIHCQVYGQIKAQFDSYHPNGIFFEKLQTIVPFFKFYFQYCIHYDQANELSLKYNVHEIALSKFGLSDIFYKPIQRLPQYAMLLKQVLKYTSEDNADYKGLKSIYDQFLEINKKNNEQMDQHSNAKIIDKYQLRFPQVKISGQAHIKKFLYDEKMNLINGDLSQSCTCSFFDGLILVHNGDDYLRHLNLDQNSFQKSLMDKKYFSNVFIIHGIEGALIFQSNRKQEIMKNIQSQLLTNQDVIKVDVIGTIQRPEKRKNQSYVVYVVEIEMAQFSQCIFVRHHSLEKIEQMAEKLGIELTRQYKPHFNLSPSKLVEARKMMIQSIIQQIVVQAKKKQFFVQIIQELLIDVNFFYQSCKPLKITYLPGQTLSNFLYKIYTTKKQKFQFIYKEPDMEIDITLPYAMKIPLNINLYNSVQDVIIAFFHKIKVKYFQDFQLCVVCKDQTYYLDPDESMKKFIKSKKTNFLGFQTFDNNFQFTFKKTIFGPLELEIQEYIKDQTKLELVVQQMNNSIFEEQIQLDDIEYIAICVLNLYQKYDHISTVDGYKIQQFLKGILPNSYLNKFNQNILIKDIQKLWKQLIFVLKQLQNPDSVEDSLTFEESTFDKSLSLNLDKSQSCNELDGSFSGDKNQVNVKHVKKRYSGMKNQSIALDPSLVEQFDFKTFICPYFDFFRSLKNRKQAYNLCAKIAILAILEERDQYGFMNYDAKVYKNKKVKKDQLYLYDTDLPDQVILQVKYRGLGILDKFNNNQIAIIDYLTITKIYFEPKSFFIDFEVDQKIKHYRFDTYQNWEVYNLVQNYQKIHQIRNNQF